MKPKALILMTAAALLAVLAAIWISGARAPEESAESPGPLVANLTKQLDTITEVRVHTAGPDASTITLKRGEQGWGLVEKHNYPVAMDRLRSLLTAIASAQRVEAKTALAERYPQLGVEDLDHADARGVQVDLVLPERSVSLIFGDSLVRGTGTYVREVGQAQSWLIDQAIAVERKPANWLDKKIIDVGANRIAHVRIEPAQGEAFELARSDKDSKSDFALSPIPRGRELAENYQREALAGLLSGLTFEDVFAKTNRPMPEKVRHAVFALNDGRQLSIQSWEQDGHTLVQFDMSLDAAVADAWLARPLAQAETATDGTTVSSEPHEAGAEAEAEAGTAAAKPTRADLQAEVDTFSKAHGNWVYQLPAFKASNLNKALEDYLKPKG
ncbi:MAG TPA: DUF4340 domain-containing protein [Chiayiivirga sp.]|nr:DUF4340 domain-containing protein [Chiayiivirga sp.]